MRQLPLLALAGLLLAPALALACDDDEEPATVAGDARFETRLVVRHGAWLESELDTTWSELEPGLFLLHLRRPTGAWVAETWFFRLAAEPTRAYTFEEMQHLEEAGAIDRETPAGLISDQVLVYAADAAQAARLARAMRPRSVPARVVEALHAAGPAPTDALPH